MPAWRPAGPPEPPGPTLARRPGAPRHRANADLRDRRGSSGSRRHASWCSCFLDQFHSAGLGHNTLTEEGLAPIVRSGEGLLRRTGNLCLSSLIEAVRDHTRIVDLKQVNRVLIQTHWRKDCDHPLP